MSATQTRTNPKTQAPPVVKRYRLLAGMHIEHPPTGEKDTLGVPILGEVVYHPGDIVETATNLMERNAPGKPPKFALADMDDAVRLNADSRVWDSSRETLADFVERMKKEGLGIPADRPKPELGALNEKELRSLAAEYQIDVSKCKNHADVLKTMQAVFAS